MSQFRKPVSGVISVLQKLCKETICVQLVQEPPGVTLAMDPRRTKTSQAGRILFLPEAGGQPLRFVVSQSPPMGNGAFCHVKSGRGRKDWTLLKVCSEGKKTRSLNLRLLSLFCHFSS